MNQMIQGQKSSNRIIDETKKISRNIMLKNQQTSKQNILNFIKQKISYSKKIQQEHFSKCLQQLNLKFNHENYEDLEQLAKILLQILKYPSSQLADLHRDSNKLGIYDLPEYSPLSLSSQLVQNQMSNNQQQIIESEYCPCCGFVKQDDQLKLCHSDLQSVQNLGISTFLYFRTIKNLCFLLISMILIYSVYAISTNVISNNENISNVNLNYLTISMGSKILNLTSRNKNLLFIQTWIGLVMVFLWGFIFFFQYHWQKEKQEQVDKETLSAADFSIVIENLPIEMDQNILQEQFDQFQKRFSGVQLKIASYNQGKPFYFDQKQIFNENIKRILKQQEDLRKQIIGWILERKQKQQFSLSKSQRDQIIKRFFENKEEKIKQYKKQIRKIEQKYKQEHQKIITTTAFISFSNSSARDFLTKDDQHKVLQKIREILPCIQNQKSFKLKIKKPTISDSQQIIEGQKSISYHNVYIQKAPQPQDVEWMNIGVTNWSILKNTILTYSITLVLLGVSFGSVYGLAIVQNNNKGSRYISILISLIITLINIIISQVIRFLSNFQRNLTKTRYQTSLALKSILAQLLNSILVPIITNRFIKNNIYELNGLADDIFVLGITNAFLPPILKIFDGYYFFLKFMRWYFNRPQSKLWLTQLQLNEGTARMEFEIGYQYIYLINLFLFTCFFVTLQPILSIFSLFGLILMFWAQKYSLFSRCRRPIPGTNILNTYLTQLIYFGGFFYSLGNLMLLNFFNQNSVPQTLIPDILSLCIGVIIIIIPYGYISQKIDDQYKPINLNYQQKRKFLPSEYDRVNPATSKQAIKKFTSYIKQEREKLKTCSKAVKNDMLKLFLKQGKQSHEKNNILKLIFSENMQDNQNMSCEAVNPQFIANLLFKNDNNTQQAQNNPLLNEIFNFSSQVKRKNDWVSMFDLKINKTQEKQLNMIDVLVDRTRNGVDEEHSGLSKEEEESKVGVRKLNQLKIKSRK